MRDEVSLSISTGYILENMLFEFMRDHNIKHDTPKEIALAIQMFADNVSYVLMDSYDIDPLDLVTEDTLL